MFNLCVAALHMHASPLAHSKGQVGVSEGAAGTAAGSGRERETRRIGRQGATKSGEVVRIRGSRTANDFSTGGVRQRESWLTCLD